MNRKIDAVRRFNMDRLSNFITLRLARLRHAIERRTANQGLRGLCFQQPRRQLVTDYRCHPTQRRFRQRTHRIARLTLPALTPIVAQLTQGLVARETCGVRIAMLPDARIVRRRDAHRGVS